MSDAITEARDLLECNGYVVLKAKSYHQAQERQRVAEALRQYAEELRAGTQRWVETEWVPRERHLSDRLTFVYGVARAHGITVAELSQE